jgi:hypothetical protein
MKRLEVNNYLQGKVMRDAQLHGQGRRGMHIGFLWESQKE